MVEAEIGVMRLTGQGMPEVTSKPPETRERPGCLPQGCGRLHLGFWPPGCERRDFHCISLPGPMSVVLRPQPQDTDTETLKGGALRRTPEQCTEEGRYWPVPQAPAPPTRPALSPAPQSSRRDPECWGKGSDFGLPGHLSSIQVPVHGTPVMDSLL